MSKQNYKLLVISSVAVFALSCLLSACGGGGSSAPTGDAPLTGTSSITSSAISRVASSAIERLQGISNSLQNSWAAQDRTRGRQALELDDDLGLYYTVDWDDNGARIHYFRDSGGQQEAGECLYRATNNSYELMLDIHSGAQPMRAYVKLAETNQPERVRLRARYEDVRTGEKISIDGELIAALAVQNSQVRPLQEDFDAPDWTDEFDWWTDENDFFFGDDYFGENPFCGDEDYFTWQDDTEFNYGDEECASYDEVVDFEIVRFEGSMTYEGCGTTLQISNAVVDFETGQLTGDCAIGDATGVIDYNTDTGQGQIVLSTVQGQVAIQFRDDEIEAIYPDGRRERVQRRQWQDPCAGVAQGRGAKTT
ncbi:MAG: hypothetical protein KatS3mg019_2115 [Fimbriimonadales bacterium]|nr:MAG: hypothetical protein KatS3mg019_2115 [Fimbriimonadales bacterium]